MNTISPRRLPAGLSRLALAASSALLVALPCAAQSSVGTPVLEHTAETFTPVHDFVLTPLGDDAVAIDAQGRIAVNQGTLAFLFTPKTPHAPTGELTPLGTLGGEYSIGMGINAVGHIAGFSTLASGAYRAALGSEGALTSIGTLSGDYSSATNLNDLGQVVGFSYTASEQEHGFLWTPTTVNGTSGTMVDLGTLGGEYSQAAAVNNHGVVVGYAYTAQGAFHAYRYSGGHMTDLGTFPGGPYSEALALNDRGQIVGQSYLAGGAAAHACLWDATGLHDLGALAGPYSEALAIDSSGKRIVGQASVPGGEFLHYHAVLWMNGKLLDLNDLLPAGSGWELERASGLNDQGQIVGSGTLNGQVRGFLLTPS